MNIRVLTSLGIAAASLTAAGCASSSAQPVANTDSEVLIESQQQRISALEEQLRDRDSELATVRAASSTSNSGSATVATNELFPPNALPGHCYARILTPAQYNETQETVLLKEASERVEIVPATFETVAERVLLKEASTRLEVVPARYETRTERVMVKPASTRIEQVPATYRTETEQVLVTPARTEWKRGPASSFAGNNNVLQSRTTDTGEIMCLVEVPAVYKTVTRTVVDTKATTREIDVPAEYRTVEKEVLVEPASTREVTIPAEYGTVEVVRQVSPASERRIEVPAEYTTVTQRNKVSEEVLAWREVVCDVNLTRGTVTELQTALRSTGHYRGPIDGILGPMTLAAANDYASRNGLPTGNNYIALEVANELGLNL